MIQIFVRLLFLNLLRCSVPITANDSSILACFKQCCNSQRSLKLPGLTCQPGAGELDLDIYLSNGMNELYARRFVLYSEIVIKF